MNNILSTLGSVLLNDHLCKLWITLELFFSNNSLLHLAFFSLDAYLHLVSFVARHSADVSNVRDDTKRKTCFKGKFCNPCSSDEQSEEDSMTKTKKKPQVGLRVSLVWLISPWIVSSIQSTVEFILDEAEVKSEDMALESGLCFIPEKNFVLLGFWFSYLFPMFMAIGFAKMWRRKLSEHFSSFQYLSDTGWKGLCCSTSILNVCSKFLNSSKRDGKRSYSYHRLDKSPLGLTHGRTISTPPGHLHKFFLLSRRMEGDPLNGLGFQSLRERNQITTESSIECHANRAATPVPCDDRRNFSDDNLYQDVQDFLTPAAPKHFKFRRHDSKDHLKTKLLRNIAPSSDSLEVITTPSAFPSHVLRLKTENLSKSEDPGKEEEKGKGKSKNGEGLVVMSTSSDCDNFLDRTTSTSNLLTDESSSSNKDLLHRKQALSNHRHYLHLPSLHDGVQSEDTFVPNFSNFSPSKEKHTSRITVGLVPKVPSIIHPPPTHSPPKMPPLSLPPITAAKTAIDHFSPNAHRMVMRLLLVYCLAWFPLQICNVVYAVCFWRECRSHVTYAEVMTFKWMAYSSAFICNLIVLLSLPK